MIYSLNGTLVYKGTDFLVIECGGVGYKCAAALNTLRAMPEIGKNVRVFTHMIVREDAMELCGFAEESELNCFKLLISISGVGAKAALAILSVLTPEQLAVAVSAGDSKALTKANGIGNKTAQRIILELKDKVKKLAPMGAEDGRISAGVSVMAEGNLSKALGALAVLGYTPEEVTPFMAEIDPSLPVERIIGETLKAIGKK